MFVTLFVHNNNLGLNKILSSLFPLDGATLKLFLSLFLVLSMLNVFSLVNYSYPVTTTLRFNLRLAFVIWLVRVFLYFIKIHRVATLLPENSPWYLVPFLRLVELISISVRPVTLAFRLLANISAGHVLLNLITKLDFAWILGSSFGILELMVCIVQAFVLLILLSVYLEESVTHSIESSMNMVLKQPGLSIVSIHKIQNFVC